MSARRVFHAACLALGVSRCFLPSGSRADEPGRETLTVERAITLALENDTRVQNAQLAVERVGNDLATARTRRYPEFDVEVQASKLVVPVEMTFPRGAFGDLDPVGPFPSEETHVESSTDLVVSVSSKVVQPISQLYRIGLGVRAGELGRDLEEERLREQRLIVVNEVRRVYYAILASEQALEVSRQQLDADRELGRTITDQVAREALLPEKEIEINARIAAQEYTVLSLRGEVASRREQLNVLLGRSLDTDFAVAEVADELPEQLDWETIQARALAQRPDLAEARLQMELAETDRRSKKSELLPDLSLAFTYQSFFNVELLPRDVTQVGLLLQWEPFDWGRKRQELAERTHAVAQARNAASAARDRALMEVRNRYRQVDEARALLEARRLAWAAAREKARVAANRHAEEMSVPGDALQAQAASADANVQYQQALLSLWTARADLEEAIGETL